MDRDVFLDNYQLYHRTRGSLQNYEKLASIFSELLKKRTTYKNGMPFSYFSKEIAESIVEPLDYQCPTVNQKETCIRCIYHFLSKNKLIEALHALLYLVHHYILNNSFVWRTGFHILSRIGDQNSMNAFFNAMLENNVWDISNLYYEYMLFLMDKKQFSKIAELYHSTYTRGMRHKRHMREPEAKKVHRLIKLQLAVASYCLWKESVFSGKENESYRQQAESQFSELRPAIGEHMVVDSFLLNYVDLLECSDKLDKALEILQLYHDTCPNNIHSAQFLLDFLIRNQQNLSQITDEMVSELRSEFVLKQLRISPNASDFIVRCFRTHVEHLNEKGEHEDITKLLFDYLSDKRWEAVCWPWEYLLISVQNLGVSNPVVQESWVYIRDFWVDTYFRCPRNDDILVLSKILN